MRIPILKSDFTRNVGTLLTGTIVARGLTVLAVPILTRLYTPSDFGLLGAFLAMIMVGLVAVNGGYEYAIMLPKQEEQARGLLLLCLRLAVVITAILWMLSWILLPTLGLTELLPWWGLFGLSWISDGTYQALYVYHNREKRYKLLARIRVIRAVLQAVLCIVLGLMEIGFQGLIIGFVAGQVVAALCLSVAYLQLDKSDEAEGHNYFQLAQQYRDFPLFSLGSNWLKVASRQMPLLVLPSLFSTSVAGFYQQAHKVISLPVGVIGAAYGNVFYQRAAELFPHHPTSLWQLTWKSCVVLLVLAAIPSGIVIAFGPALFGWILGEEWLTTGVYARWLMPWFWLVLVANPLAHLIEIRRKLGVFMGMNAAFFATQMAVLWWATTNVTALQAVQALGAAGTFFTALQVGYFLWLGRMSPTKTSQTKPTNLARSPTERS
ncbi:MAG: oligosaccharide flippase family protein [Bacteroidota bacterium]